MTARVVVILVVSHAVMLGMGFWVGVEVVRRLATFGVLEELALSQRIASTAFNETSGDAARETLLRNEELLEHLGPAVLSPTELAIGRMRTLTRVWKVEVGAGRGEQATYYRAKVQRVCEEARWRDCSDQAMERLLNLH